MIYRTAGYLTIALFVGTLLVFNGGSWVFLQVTRESKEQDLGKRLIAIASTASIVIGNENLRLPEASLIANYVEHPDYEYLLSLLRWVRVKNNLLNVQVLDSNGNVLVDSRQKMSPGTPHPYIEIDRVELEQAVRGEPATTPYYLLEKVPRKRAYVPVTAPDGTLLYVLRLEASRDYFQDLDILKRHMIWVDGIGSLLLAFIAFIVYVIIKRLIRAEETVAQTERLQALGTMAASVAHEIRNPLGIIRASAEDMKDAIEESNTTYCSALDDIIAECDRINHEISNFLQLTPSAKPAKTNREQAAVLTVNEVLQDLKKSVQKMGERRNISIHFNIPAEKMRIRIDPIAFRQTLLNLILNAIDACQQGGTVDIRASRSKRKPDHLNIKIVDTGKGMTPRQVRRVFDPFFTTKSQGTGLGLTIARRAVEQAGGTLTIQSQPNKGTQVTISLPVFS